MNSVSNTPVIPPVITPKIPSSQANHPAGLFYAALLGGSAVALGAFGAHALKNTLEPPEMQIYETAVRYQMYHALALLALGLARWKGRSSLWLLGGTLVFSGSLYLLAFTRVPVLGAITPIGGILQMVGWGMLALEAWRRR
jgi:uncharacterized membrane protein YgdD (TMEM256/DUF423 family)